MESLWNVTKYLIIEEGRRFYFSNQKFSSGITLLVSKGKLEEFKAIISQSETDTYKIRVREMKILL